MINIALVDDHIAVRKGVKQLIEIRKKINVIIEADNGIELLTILEKSKTLPEIIVLDMHMPAMNGQDTLDLVRDRWPKIKCIIYSFYSEEDRVIDMINRGACSYLNKSSDAEILSKSIIAVHKNGYFIGDLARKEYFNQKAGTLIKGAFYGTVKLTPKEVEFIKLSATDHTYTEIAAIMRVSPKTLENYRDNLLRKLALRNRMSIALYGIKNGIVNLDEEKPL
jgi:DNA-binding NarL/FixJ family response regulator